MDDFLPAERERLLTTLRAGRPWGHSVLPNPHAYFVAWLHLVPFGVIVRWYVVGHAECGH
jgi:hypothetical protein